MPDAGHPRGKRHEQRGDGRSDMVIWTATPPVFTTRPASRGRSRTRRPERRRNRRLAPGVVRHRRAELLPPALAKVRAALPHLEISLRVADRDQALSTLRQGTLDLAVIEVHPARGDGPRPDLRPLLSDPFRIVVPRGHRLAKKHIIKLTDAADEPWIDIRCEVGCCRAATSSAFRQAGFDPRRLVEADEYWPAQGFVAARLGLDRCDISPPMLSTYVQPRPSSPPRFHRCRTRPLQPQTTWLPRYVPA